MLAGHKLDTILDIIKTSSKEELAWLNGYLSGILADVNIPAPSEQTVTAKKKITIVFGTETGNSKSLATTFANTAKTKGIIPKLVSLDQYRFSDLTKEENFLAIISTHGDGEPPISAKKFYDQIHVNGFTIPKMKYGVLALGDTSYPLFCKAGEDVDQQFQKLGANRIVPLQKCDVDYEEQAKTWFEHYLQSLDSAPAAVIQKPVLKKSTEKKIYNGVLISKCLLNGRGSAKETFHLEIAADDIEYEPGDAIGIVPENHEEVINAIIKLCDADAQQALVYKNETCTIYELLKSKLNISNLPLRVIKKYEAIINHSINETRISLLDLLTKYPLPKPHKFMELIGILEPLSPRLYSISSSPAAHEGEVHITVVKDKFFYEEESQFGLCSSYLAARKVDSTFNFFVHKNRRFRLPAGDKDIIMIGPGTGIAPYRSFIAERDSTGATGRNWLFFGDQHFTTDFLYQTEWQNYFSTGVLTNISLAFSRDQNEKIYVQNKMRERATELFEWIQHGAYIYVCGTKDPMSKDVETELLKIISDHKKITSAEAVKFLDSLKSEGRYCKDVY